MSNSSRPTPSSDSPSPPESDASPTSERLRLEVDVLKGARLAAPPEEEASALSDSSSAPDASPDDGSIDDEGASSPDSGALGVLLVLVLSLAGLAGHAASTRAQTTNVDARVPESPVHDASAHLKAQSTRLAYVPNRGQWDEEVLFQARGGGFTAWVTGDGITYDFFQRSNEGASGNGAGRGHVVRMDFEGGEARSTAPTDRLAGVHNYYRGTDPQDWAERVPRYGELRLQELYPGIALRLYGQEGRPRYDLIAEPGANLAQASFRLDGAEDVRVTPEGDLAFVTSLGEVRQADLVAYQEVGGRREEIDAAFTVRADGRVGFDVTVPYPHVAVVIDPILYSTFLSGTSDERGRAIAVEDGNAYVAGITRSADFPTTTGAYAETPNGSDGSESFVTQVAPDGESLLYSTFMSGGVKDIAVEGGSVYLTGIAGPDFPTTSGAFQTTYGNTDTPLDFLDSGGGCICDEACPRRRQSRLQHIPRGRDRGPWSGHCGGGGKCLRDRWRSDRRRPDRARGRGLIPDDEWCVPDDAWQRRRRPLWF